MANLISLLGKKFGYLTVISQSKKRLYGRSTWICKCDCGNELIVTGNSLKQGNTQTCGKYTCKFFMQNKKKHGQWESTDYRVWTDIKQRCLNINCKEYKNYGGRGIKMYKNWIDSFQDFYDYLQTLPETREQFEARTGEKALIERINVNGNYEPGNLKWSSIKDQNRNKRQSVLNEQMVKYILWETQINKLSVTAIYAKLKQEFNFQGHRQTVYEVAAKRNWTDINIDNEIHQFMK